MSKEKIEVEGAKVYGPYSSGIKAGGMIYLAGQIAPEAGDDIVSQTGAVLAKIDALLAAAGTDRNSLVFAQVLLAEIDDFAAMNEVYGDVGRFRLAANALPLAVIDITPSDPLLSEI